LSEFLEKGYGRCTQLSVAYLYLAQQAGIEGCFMGSDSGAIKNVLKDENTKLFRSAEVGAPVGAHSWVELKLSDGR
jgi:transglutaminase-like putative cysteine protease